MRSVAGGLHGPGRLQAHHAAIDAAVVAHDIVDGSLSLQRRTTAATDGP